MDFFLCDLCDPARDCLSAGGMRVASISGGSVRYFHKDHLGSTSAFTDGSGTIVETADYRPFGGLRDYSGAVTTNYRFTDQEYDPESGLYNYRARLYDPALGRFISADTLVQSPYGPQTLNRYSYTGNNPLVYVDPSGHLFGIDDILIGALVGGIIGGAAAEASGGDFWKDGFRQGAVTGAIFGAISGVGLETCQGVEEALAGMPGTTYQTLSSTTLAGIYGAAGGVAGGITADMSGGDFWQGFGVGAVTGGLGSFGAPALKPFGSSATASIPNRLFNSALVGGGLGGTAAVIRGEDFWRGARRGAKTWALWEGINMYVGHRAGRLMGGKPEFRDGVWYYDIPGTRPFSIGGSVVGDYNYMIFRTTRFGASVLDHEIAHSYGKQGILGPVYLPGHLASQGISWLLSGGNTHSLNLFERWWHEYPDY